MFRQQAQPMCPPATALGRHQPPVTDEKCQRSGNETAVIVGNAPASLVTSLCITLCQAGQFATSRTGWRPGLSAVVPAVPRLIT